MASDTVTATWVGPFPMELPDTHPEGRRQIEPGEKVKHVPRTQAQASDFWDVQGGDTPAKKTAKKTRTQAEPGEEGDS